MLYSSRTEARADGLAIAQLPIPAALRRRDAAGRLIDPIGLKAIGAKACHALIHRTGKTDLFVIVDFTIARRAAGQLLESGRPDPRYPGAAAFASNVYDFFGESAGRDAAEDQLRRAGNATTAVHHPGITATSSGGSRRNRGPPRNGMAKYSNHNEL
jgi:hypothetical protein